MRRFMLVFGLGLLLASLTPAAASQPADEMTVYRDRAAFEAAHAPLRTLGFESLPPNGSSHPDEWHAFIPNPLALDGAVFIDPSALGTGHWDCAACQPAPRASSMLFLNPGATIELPAGTSAAMIVVDGMGDTPFVLEATDLANQRLSVPAQPVTFYELHLGFSSPAGLRRLRVVSTGGGVYGPVAISSILLKTDGSSAGAGFWTDRADDAFPANADIVAGSAAVSVDGALDLRVRFSSDPFRNLNTQHVTWCFNTDGDPASGAACDLPGADAAVRLTGQAGALYGHSFTLNGPFGDLDPCEVGSYEWETHTLRLVVPRSRLSGSDAMAYAVLSHGDLDPAPLDQAPDTIVFSDTAALPSSVAAEPASFAGTLLCAGNRDATVTLRPTIQGTLYWEPERGNRGIAPVGAEIQSTYFRTTEQNRVFRRGLFEFALPDLGAEACIASATLVLYGGGGATGAALPPEAHELSWYEGADLALTLEDYDRPTLPMSPTLLNFPSVSSEMYSIDVTAVITGMVADTLGFRVKLADDPGLDLYGSMGTSFGSNGDNRPQLLIRLCDAQAPITPAAGGSLIHAGGGASFGVTAGPGAVAEPTMLVYERAAGGAAAALTEGATRERVLDRFYLDGYQQGERQSDLAFAQPLLMAIGYVERAGLREQTLTVQRWNGNRWEYAACGAAERDTAGNRLVVPVCRAGDYRLVGLIEVTEVFLPLLSRR